MFLFWHILIKLSHQSGSKLRDNLNLDDRNLFKMRNPGTDTDEVDPDLEVDWDTVRSSINNQPEEDNWSDETLLHQQEMDGTARMTPDEASRRPTLFSPIASRPTETSLSVERENQQWLDNVSRMERPGEREGRYIDQEITMRPLRPPSPFLRNDE